MGQRLHLKKKRRALLHCESLVGAGHITTMRTLAYSMIEQGFDVTLVSGSRLVKAPHLDFEGVNVVDLPQAKGDFETGKVLTENDKSISQDILWRYEYKNKLLGAYKQTRPDVVVTEFWPVRRGEYDFAMMPLMHQIEAERHSRDIQLYCLLRDYVHMSVTNSGAFGTDDGAREILERHYFSNQHPSVIVRGVEGILPIEESFFVGSETDKHVYYAGYFVPEPQSEECDLGTDEVLVTSGGGYMDYCFETSMASIKAAQHTAFAQKSWRILLPKDTPEDKFAELAANAEQSPVDITVEHNRADFIQRLRNTDLLITHAGDTIGEAVKLGRKVVALPRILQQRNNPHTGEQQRRAEAFDDADLIKIAMPADLESTEHFASIIDGANDLTPQPNPHGFNGQNLMAQLITNCLNVSRMPTIPAIKRQEDPVAESDRYRMPRFLW